MDREVEAVIARLDEFHAAYSHMYVHTHYRCDDGFQLGQWVMRRRSEKRRGRLHPRYEVLDIVPGWDWDSVDARLVEGLYRLEAYVERYGTARVPLWYECDDGFRLGVWVRNRRNGPKRYPWLTEILERMPSWGTRRRCWESEQQRNADRLADKEILRRVEVFHTEHGTGKVPRGYACDDGFRLGAILAGRRRRSLERHEALLRAIAAFPEEPPRERLHEEALVRLWGYVQEHQAADVLPSHVEPDGFRLGAWIAHRRRLRGRDSTVDAALESLPGWTWSPIEQAFMERVREFERVASDGRVVRNPSLRRWTREQQRAAQAGKLPPARLERLREAGVL
jgi:Helicase associated domain